MLIRQLRKSETGGAIIEYALVFPVFIFMLFSIIELGLIAYADALIDTLGTQVSRWAKTGYDYSEGQSYTFQGGAQEGFAPGTQGDHYSVDAGGTVIMNGREGFLREWLRGTTKSFLNPEKLLLSTQIYDSLEAAGFNGVEATPYDVGQGMDAVAFTVSYQWDVFSPLLYPFLGTTTTLSSVVIMQNEAF